MTATPIISTQAVEQRPALVALRLERVPLVGVLLRGILRAPDAELAARQRARPHGRGQRPPMRCPQADVGAVRDNTLVATTPGRSWPPSPFGSAKHAEAHVKYLYFYSKLPDI